MTVYILEQRTNYTDYDIVGVVTRAELAHLFYDNDRYNRRWRSKWVDDPDLLVRLSREKPVDTSVSAQVE